MKQNAKSVLDEDSPVPLFMQIRLELLSEILNWPEPGLKFYGDNELAHRFGVSRMTVRQAISGIVADGLLQRFSGHGTYVTDRVFVERLDRNLDISGQYAEVGVEQHVRVLTCEFRAAAPEEKKQIDLEPGEDLLFIVRTRSIASSPLAVDERLIAGSIAREAGFAQANVSGSIIDRLRGVTRIDQVNWEIGAGTAGNAMSTLLLLKPKDAILERRMTYLDNDDRRILSGRTVHRAEMVRYGFNLHLEGESRAPRELMRSVS